MGNLPKELKTSPFLLKWISGGVGFAVKLHSRRGKFYRLACGRGIDDLAIEPDTCAGSDFLEQIGGDFSFIYHDLQIFETGSVA